MDDYLDLTFPVRGMDLTQEFAQQRPGSTPVGTNVRAFEPATDRARGGSRSGLVQFIPAAVDETGVRTPLRRLPSTRR